MKSKKVIVHCSTNAGSSNFGDVLFAYMILEHLQELGYQCRFYELSEYNRNYLFRTHGLMENNFSIVEADAAIYFAGGYFGEKKHERIDLSIRHYRRFMPFGKKVLKLNIPLSIIGIGAGDYLWFPSKLVVKQLCNDAVVITTRDEESTNYLRSIGVKTSNIVTCSDIAQTLPRYSFIANEPVHLQCGYEYIFLHTNYMKDVATFFCEGIRAYLDSNPNTKVIIGSDNIANIEEPYNIAVRLLGLERTIKYTYTTPENLCELLKKCSLILTYKLHVGIISATFGRSVIAIAKHEKIKRYYKQIGESERCIMFDECTPEKLSGMIKKYCGKTIHLPDEILKLANKNWDVLDGFLEHI